MLRVKKTKVLSASEKNIEKDYKCDEKILRLQAEFSKFSKLEVFRKKCSTFFVITSK